MMTDVYLHAECPATGLHLSMALHNVDPAKELSETATIPIPCPACGQQKHVAHRVTEWEFRRLTAEGEECAKCDQEIAYLHDRATWVHVDFDGDILDPDYGEVSVLNEDSDAWHDAEPSGRTVSLDLRTGMTTKIADKVKEDDDQPPPPPKVGTREQTIENFPGLRGTVR